MKDFVHLHLHSEYSLLDGACRIADIPRAAAAAGHRAVAITDHGVMYGAVAFFRACREVGVKPIIGCEVYVAPRSRHLKEGKSDSSGYHLILLCKDEVGYKNLISMVSSSFVDGFYAKPRIDMELLEKHHEGLVALSACLAGYIPRMILLGNMKGAEEYALRMQALFGGDFYLELQDHGIGDEATVCRALVELSRKTGIPLVATNDVHYLEKSDAEIQATMMCIQTNSTVADGRSLGFETDEFYYKSTDEMDALFGHYAGALENSVAIAEKCNFEFRFGEIHMPSFPTPAGTSHRELLAAYTEEGFRKRVAAGDIRFDCGDEAAYRKQIDYELSVIGSMGFAGYYLIVQDFIAYARSQGIPVGPGRGSGAGSLVAYCVGITDIDPFRYGLLFERFLNPERISMPDFDTDICYERRDEVIRYIRTKYGEDHVAQIVTFGTLSARAAVRDVGRALNLPYAEVDAIAKAIPQGVKIKITDALKSKEIKEKYESSDTVRRLLDTAMALEGMPRHASTHAAGILITEDSLSGTLPLATNGDAVVVQYDMDTVAELGLVKFDLLGLRYITIIWDAEQSIRTRVPDFSIASVPQDDPETYAHLSAGRTDGIFQLESAGMRKLLVGMQPRSLHDIVAAIALYRPGPMDSIPQYLACRNGTLAPQYEVPELAEILGDTAGCIVYQEQVMQIFRRLAGYSFARADLVRRAMSKKKEKQMAAEREGFLEGALTRGISREAALSVFERMRHFAEYAFNKSHAAAYATLSFRTAYLRVHYPREYLAALLSSVLGDQVKTSQYVAEATRSGIAVLPPDINESGVRFSVSGGSIRFGLLAVRNVGEPTVRAIVRERENGRFTSFSNFLERLGSGELNRRQVEALIKCGAFDSLGVFRSQLLASYEKMLDEYAERSRSNLSGQIDIFTMQGPAASTEFSYPQIPELSLRERLMLEKESTGIYFSGHAIDEYAGRLQKLSCTSIFSILEAFADGEEGTDTLRDGTPVTVGGILTKRVNKTLKNGNSMCIVTVEDRYGEMDAVAFSSVLARYGAYLEAERAVVIKGKISAKEGKRPEILIQSVLPLDSAEGEKAEVPKRPKRLFLRVRSLSDDLTRDAVALLSRYPGDTEVAVYEKESARYVVAGVTVSPSDALIERLRRMLGSENVVYQ